jgi:hypothetical protein
VCFAGFRIEPRAPDPTHQRPQQAAPDKRAAAVRRDPLFLSVRDTQRNVQRVSLLTDSVVRAERDVDGTSEFEVLTSVDSGLHDKAQLALQWLQDSA